MGPPRGQARDITRADPGIDASFHGRQGGVRRNGLWVDEGTTWVRDGKGSGSCCWVGLLDNVLYKITPDNTVSGSWRGRVNTGDDPDSVGYTDAAGRCTSVLIRAVLLRGGPRAGYSGAADWDGQEGHCGWEKGRDPHSYCPMEWAVSGLMARMTSLIQCRMGGVLTDNDFGLRGVAGGGEGVFF